MLLDMGEDMHDSNRLQQTAIVCNWLQQTATHSERKWMNDAESVDGPYKDIYNDACPRKSSNATASSNNMETLQHHILQHSTTYWRGSSCTCLSPKNMCSRFQRQPVNPLGQVSDTVEKRGWYSIVYICSTVMLHTATHSKTLQHTSQSSRLGLQNRIQSIVYM